MSHENSDVFRYEVYYRIFEGVEGVEDLRRAIARAVSELRAAMDKEPNSAVTLAHIRNLSDLSPVQLARAYTQAEQNCVYWPSPGQIRELAEGSVEQQTAESLQIIFVHLENYGYASRGKGGTVIFGDDGTGRRVLLATEPATPMPELLPIFQSALNLLGNGSVKHGLMYVNQHPRMRGWEVAGDEAAAKTAERIERQWMRCYRQALREQKQLKTNSERAR